MDCAYLGTGSKHTVPAIAASMEDFGMLFLRHCSITLAKLLFSSGLGPPSAKQMKQTVDDNSLLVGLYFY